MSSRNLNPDQLKMFMTPREIAATIPQNETHVTSPKDLRKDPVARQKMNKAQRNGLADSIAKEGVKKPLDIMFGDPLNDPSQLHKDEKTLVNGHHRFSVSLDIAPDTLVPVLHHEKYSTVDWTGGDEDPTGSVPYGNPNAMWGD